MPLVRAQRSVDRLRALATGALRVPAPPLRMDARVARILFESQLYCRLVDVAAHELRARRTGYYTICSAGHEGNAALGALTRDSDPALLHYRSGAFFLARARACIRAHAGPELEPSLTGPPGVLELLLSLAASKDDPIAGGRHKVFGSIPWGIPPQTSTIASHLPKAVGIAMGIERRGRLAARGTAMVPRDGSLFLEDDSIVVCSFGDGSFNHSTAQGALNAASWTAYQNLPLPVLFVCEDNGLGVSVRTPPGWIESRMSGATGIHYVQADGGDLSSAYERTQQAIARCRGARRPVFLHLSCTRVWGHAGSDADGEYRSDDELEQAEGSDPVLRSAQTLLDAGALRDTELSMLIEESTARVHTLAVEAEGRSKLTTREEVMAPVAPTRPDRVYQEARSEALEAPAVDHDKPKALCHGIRAGLGELLHKYPEMMIFGEDVAEKGGVYGATVGLRKRFGAARVFNTLLDEQTILGLAIGLGQAGFLPVPEIQFLAYLHNAEDQLRGEAATLSFFSQGQLKNPMVVRIAGLGYQKGFGGHFHNDNSLGVLRDLPGVIVGVPSRADDAVKMLRTMAAAAHVDGRVCVLVEPIALYHQKDLLPGDGAWAFPTPAQGQSLAVGEVGVYEDGVLTRTPRPQPDLVVLTYGNGVPMSLRVAQALGPSKPRIRVVDLRWISPLPEEAIVRLTRDAGAVLVVDECRRNGNVSEAILAVLSGGPRVATRRVTSADSFVPLADAANLVLLSEAEIFEAAGELLARRAPNREPAQGPSA